MSAVIQSKILFRPMQIEDLDDVMTIEPTIYSHPWTRGNFRDSLKAGHSAWVMTIDEVVIGYALMMVVIDEAQLLNISIAQPMQKQGFGHSLMTHMIDKAKAANAKTVFLEVRQSNRNAQALYQKMGFVEMSVRRGYYPTANGREDAAIMRLSLC